MTAADFQRGEEVLAVVGAREEAALAGLV